MYKNFVQELKSEGVCVNKQVSKREVKFTIEPKPVANQEPDNLRPPSEKLETTEPQNDSPPS